jgi:transposase
MGSKDEEHAMSAKLNSGIAVVGIDIGKNSFDVVGQRGPRDASVAGCPSRGRTEHVR